MTANDKPKLHVRIISPQQLILDTEAESVSSKNVQGNFDVLPQHANFMTLIENSHITVRPPNQKPLVFKFSLAILVTRSNKVDIYTYIQPQNSR